MPRWLGAVVALVVGAACAGEAGTSMCGGTVCSEGRVCCVSCAGSHYCSNMACPSPDTCSEPDAGEPDAGEPDAVDAGQDGGAADAGDDGGAADGGGVVDAGDEDAGPAPLDAGADGGFDAGVDGGLDAGVDAGPACVAEVCDGADDDCDSRIDEDAPCPCPVVQGTSGNAYMFCDVDREWSAARADCEADGYSLVVIEDAAEDAFVYAELETRGFGQTWIGLNDRDTERTWVWLDGIAAAYTNWDIGSPDGFGEDCAVLMTRPPWRASEWDDRDCADARPYVCEAPPPP